MEPGTASVIQDCFVIHSSERKNVKFEMKDEKYEKKETHVI